jgi:hypothetical protein
MSDFREARPMRTNRLNTSPDLDTPHRVRIGVAAAALLLAACGGGGGGSTPATEEQRGLVQVTVNDAYGAAVPGASVAGPRGTSTTAADGTAYVTTDSPGASATVTITRDAFVPQTVVVASTPGQVSSVPVVLDRATAAAGGSLTSRSGVGATPDAIGQTLHFEIELVVVDGDSRPIESLTAADFVLRPCVPDPADERFDCVRGAVAADDTAYVATTPSPTALALVPGAAARPFASALLIDQSASIAETDPTGARLYASKVFVQALGVADQVLLAAFASGTDALVPGAPLAVYGPFRGADQAGTYLDTLDTLATQVAGGTPLYASVDALREQWLSGTAAPAGLGKAIVVFTDGDDSQCGTQQTCRDRRAQSIQGAVQDDVRIFTVGLSDAVDIATLGELANDSGGALLYADNVTQLLPLYGSVSRLMSLSLPTYRLSWTVQANAAGAFSPGQALIGRVQVNAGHSTIEVPFVVGIP